MSEATSNLQPRGPYAFHVTVKLVVIFDLMRQKKKASQCKFWRQKMSAKIDCLHTQVACFPNNHLHCIARNTRKFSERVFCDLNVFLNSKNITSDSGKSRAHTAT